MCAAARRLSSVFPLRWQRRIGTSVWLCEGHWHRCIRAHRWTHLSSSPLILMLWCFVIHHFDVKMQFWAMLMGLTFRSEFVLCFCCWLCKWRTRFEQCTGQPQKQYVGNNSKLTCHLCHLSHWCRVCCCWCSSFLGCCHCCCGGCWLLLIVVVVVVGCCWCPEVTVGD